MKHETDWQSFLRIAGMSLGIGIVYEFAPLSAQQLEAGSIKDFSGAKDEKDR